MKKLIIAATMALSLGYGANAQDTKKEQPAGKHIVGQDSTSPNKPSTWPGNDTTPKKEKGKPLGNKKSTTQPKSIKPDSTRTNRIPSDMHH